MFDQFPDTLHWGALRVMPRALLVWRQGRPIPLTLRQFGALMALLSQPHRTLSREEIWTFCWEQERRPSKTSAVDPRVVDVYIAQLRRRLGDDAVITVRGVGYRLGPCQDVPEDRRAAVGPVQHIL